MSVSGHVPKTHCIILGGQRHCVWRDCYQPALVCDDLHVEANVCSLSLLWYYLLQGKCLSSVSLFLPVVATLSTSAYVSSSSLSPLLVLAI